MKSHGFRVCLTVPGPCVLVLLALFLIQGVPGAARTVLAQDGASLLKDADRSVRASERSMHSGKKEQALQELEGAEALLDKARSLDPANAGLKGVEQKCARQRAALERRMGKPGGAAAPAPATITAPAPGATTTAPPAPAPAATPAPAAASGQQAQLPYHARAVLKEMDQALRSLQSKYAYMDSAVTRPPVNWGEVDRRFQEIDQTLAGLPGLLQQARDEAAAKGVDAHPELDRYQAMIDAAPAEKDRKKAEMDGVRAREAAASGQVTADVEAFLAVYQPREEVIETYVYGHCTLDGNATPEEIRAAADRFRRFAQEDLPALRRAREDLSAVYGKTAEELDGNVSAAGYQGAVNPKYGFQKIQELQENIARTGTACADYIVTAQVDEKLEPGRVDSMHDFVKMDYLDGNFEEMLKIAERFDPGNARATASRATLAERIGKAKQAFLRKIDGRQWPGHSATAPGDADELAEVALAWLEKEEADNRRVQDTDPRRQIAVVVTARASKDWWFCLQPTAPAKRWGFHTSISIYTYPPAIPRCSHTHSRRYPGKLNNLYWDRLL